MSQATGRLVPARPEAVKERREYAGYAQRDVINVGGTGGRACARALGIRAGRRQHAIMSYAPRKSYPHRRRFAARCGRTFSVSGAPTRATPMPPVSTGGSTASSPVSMVLSPGIGRSVRSPATPAHTSTWTAVRPPATATTCISAPMAARYGASLAFAPALPIRGISSTRSARRSGRRSTVTTPRAHSRRSANSVIVLIVARHGSSRLRMRLTSPITPALSPRRAALRRSTCATATVIPALRRSACAARTSSSSALWQRRHAARSAGVMLLATSFPQA